MNGTIEIPRMLPEEADEFTIIRNKIVADPRWGTSTRKIVMVVGSAHGEGTTTVARNISRVFAEQSAVDVLLIELGRRNARSGEGEAGGGLSDLCNGEASSFEDLVRKTDVDRLYLLSRGKVPLEPCLMMKEEKVGMVLDRLADRFPLVFIDSPPVQAYPEASVLAAKVDGVILVVESERTKREVVNDTKNKLASFNAQILGIVLNRRKHYIPKAIYNLFC